MHAEDSLHGEAIEQAIRYDLAATADFLGRLKDEVGRSFEFAACGQILGCSEQHAGVSVVPAGMHDAWIGGSVGHSGFFRNGQRINIRAQADRLVAVATVDNRHHARSGESMYLVHGERLQAFLNESLGAALGKS